MSRYEFYVIEDGKLKEMKDQVEAGLGDLVRCEDGGIYGIIGRETTTGECRGLKMNAKTCEMDYENTYFFYPEEIKEIVTMESLKKQKLNIENATKHNDKRNDKVSLANIKPKTVDEVLKNIKKDSNLSKYNDSHYAKLDVQPMDVISKWPIQQQIGFYRGNILKYTVRLGNKDSGISEASKILRYAQWLYDALNGKIIDPRK